MYGKSFVTELTELADTFFNGRPANKGQREPKVTVEELVRRGTSTIKLGDKFYRIRATELTLTNPGEK